MYRNVPIMVDTSIVKGFISPMITAGQHLVRSFEVLNRRRFLASHGSHRLSGTLPIQNSSQALERFCKIWLRCVSADASCICQALREGFQHIPGVVGENTWVNVIEIHNVVNTLV